MAGFTVGTGGAGGSGRAGAAAGAGFCDSAMGALIKSATSHAALGLIFTGGVTWKRGWLLMSCWDLLRRPSAPCWIRPLGRVPAG